MLSALTREFPVFGEGPSVAMDSIQVPSSPYFTQELIRLHSADRPAFIAARKRGFDWDYSRAYYADLFFASRDQITRNVIQLALDAGYYAVHERLMPNSCSLFHLAADAPLVPKSLNMSMARYPFYPGPYLQESFYFHHGLRFASVDVKDYVKNRDILDAGAYTGDSLIVLDQYTDKRIVSYEIAPKLFRSAQLAATGLANSKHTLIFEGLGDRSGVMNVSEGSARVTVNVTTIDAEVERLNLTVGFIKADLEGAELKMLVGARKTLEAQHPILSIAIYHDETLITVPKFVQSIGGYRMEFRMENAVIYWPIFGTTDLCEMRLFAIPVGVR
jgi:FkbM family methyltransferase